MPVNRTLKKVRETRHFALDDVAAFTHISADRLREMEEGQRVPTFPQLDRLAEVYGVASYVLAADTLPNLPEAVVDFRHQVPRPAHLSPAGMTRIWRAEQIAVFTNQLISALKMNRPEWVERLGRVPVTIDGAATLRRFFKEWVAPREKGFELVGTPEQQTLMAFRLFLEAQGVVVNVNDAPSEDYSGFFLRPDASLPLAFVNRKIDSRKAQLFTAVHEYAHFLLKKPGVSNPFVVRNEVERACNQFAAAFLAPVQEFESLAREIVRSHSNDLFGAVRAVSSKSLLSMHATAIRLAEVALISQRQLSSWIAAAARTPRAEKDEEREGGTEFGQPHAKRIGELGYLPTFVAAEAIKAKLVDSLDVQAGMFLSESLQTKAFDLASRRMRVARSS